MKIFRPDVFKDEIYENIRRMDFEDVNGISKFIYKLVLEEEKEEIEEKLMNELFYLLKNRTSEVVKMVCKNLNIKQKMEHCDENDAKICVKSRLGCANITIINNNDETANDNINGQLKRRIVSDMQWSDISRCSQGKGGRKVDIPCPDLLESGVCMNVDYCGFSHKNGAVIKSKISKLSSFYKTTQDKVDSRSCILPSQSSYYDKMTVLPGSSKLPEDSTIDLASSPLSSPSDNNNNEPYIDLISSPRLYEPPSMLDCPLWYKEMGLVEEETDSSDSHRHSRRHRHRSLIVSNIPKSLNNIGQLNKYFIKFGALRNIQVNFKGDHTKALVEFRLSKDMHSANDCVDSVLGNRFIKTKPYNDKKRRRSSKRKRKLERRRRSERERTVASSESRSRSRSWSCDRDRDRDVEPKLESSEVVEEPVEVIEESVVKEEAVVKEEEEEVEVEVEEEVEGVAENRMEEEVAEEREEGQEDLKLERALNDSDVESEQDSCSRVRREVMLKTRRKQLQDDDMRNSAKKKLSRTSASLNYYKSVLEELIVEYRRNDKSGKARLIATIKETHCKYMELKALHGALSSLVADRRQQDLLGDKICRLSVTGGPTTNGDNEDNTATRDIYLQVPPNIVLDPVQIQGHLGSELKVDNMERLSCRHDNGTCYVLTFNAPSTATSALIFLSNNNPMKWHIGLHPPH